MASNRLIISGLGFVLLLMAGGALADVVTGKVVGVSDGDTIIDQAGEYVVAAGMGGWRVSVDYSSDTAWEQDIKIEGFANPFCLWCDPSAEDPLKRDAQYWLVATRMSKDAFEARWPKAEATSCGESRPERERRQSGLGEQSRG